MTIEAPRRSARLAAAAQEAIAENVAELTVPKGKRKRITHKREKKIEIVSAQETVRSSLSRSHESRLGEGFSNIIGIDEAGRGPVVAAACVIKPGVIIDGILDSKVVSEEDREAVYEVLVKHPDVIYSVVRIEHTEIDEINILQATMKAMRVAAENVVKQLKTKDHATTIALIDGNRTPDDMPVCSKWVIKGDGSVFSIAAASILAKVTRDRIMIAYEKEYPGYGLAQHKGYPTFSHRVALAELGPSPIHRVSYAPVAAAIAARERDSSSTEKSTESSQQTKRKREEKNTVTKQNSQSGTKKRKRS